MRSFKLLFYIGLMAFTFLADEELRACSLTVTITFPANNARFKRGLNVIIKGSVSGATNPTTISIYVDNYLKGTCSANSDGTWKFTPTGPPWGWDTSGSSRGNHTVRADAQDSLSRTGSASITVKLFRMIWPVGSSDDVTSEFGPRDGGFHYGIDIGCASGATIAAAEDGTVSSQNYDADGYGYWRSINHGSLYVELLDGSITSYRSATVTTRYAHLQDNSSSPAGGSSLAQGNTVGHEGHTGNSGCYHLHFEVREDGTAVDPRNYLP